MRGFGLQRQRPVADQLRIAAVLLRKIGRWMPQYAGSTLTASNLDRVPKMSVFDLYEFKYISRPAQISMAELKKLFEVLDINPALLDNPNLIALCKSCHSQIHAKRGDRWHNH